MARSRELEELLTYMLCDATASLQEKLLGRSRSCPPRANSASHYCPHDPSGLAKIVPIGYRGQIRIDLQRDPAQRLLKQSLRTESGTKLLWDFLACDPASQRAQSQAFAASEDNRRPRRRSEVPVLVQEQESPCRRESAFLERNYQ